MSNGDFEVMPLGTMVEVKRMREFANDMIDFAEKHDLPEEVHQKIQQIRSFYIWHTQTYPVIV